MTLIIIFSALALAAAFIKDRKKAAAGLKKAFFRFIRIMPPLLFVLFLVAIVLWLLHEERISGLLSGNNRFIAWLSALLVGSLTLMPGFIAFPLGGILVQNGVQYMAVSAFTGSLMMVGIATFPVERKFLGTGTALLRNIFYLLIAAAVSLITGFVYGELL